MPLPFPSPPASLCLLRLSALGDICHMLPIVRTIRHAWPQTGLTWIIGRTEHGLVRDIPDIEFVVLDKAHGLRGYAELRRYLRGRKFDALLHMQMSPRASLASLCVSSPVRLGFDRPRARDFQWLFTNRRIAARKREHVQDSFFGFTEALGIRTRVLRWDIPIPDDARAFAESALGPGAPILVISPCSSMSYRNWHAAGYAAVANYAAERRGLRVVLTGGPSEIEREYAQAIAARARCRPIDLVGRTDLKQLLAVIARATVLVAPDSGPAHMATAVGTPVIGLYACTNPVRARPYLSADYVVNRYPEAIDAKFGLPVEEVPWGTRVRDAGTMDRIAVADVTAMLDKLMASGSNQA
ncbi:MAG TPA: glycosyltransferase family 9 protein [Burkholderiales bacterium]|jgi:heptosyltransferase I